MNKEQAKKDEGAEVIAQSIEADILWKEFISTLSRFIPEKYLVGMR